jgi:hypothetical protein
MTSGSEVMCRKKVDAPRPIYRVFTISLNIKLVKTSKNGIAPAQYDLNVNNLQTQ